MSKSKKQTYKTFQEVPGFGGEQKHVGESIPEFEFKPLTAGQEDYIDSISKKIITLCCGPAGVGKSLCAIAMALKSLKEGKIDKICITRPCVETSRKGMGFLPGSLQEKMQPFTRPLEDIFIKLVGESVYRHLVAEKAIVIEPLEYLRGVTFENSVVILSESQNCTYDQLYMFLTRLGENCKMLIEGDPSQNDLFLFDRGYDNTVTTDKLTAFEKMVNKIDAAKLNFVGIVEMTDEDIVRSKFVKALMIALR